MLFKVYSTSECSMDKASSISFLGRKINSTHHNRTLSYAPNKTLSRTKRISSSGNSRFPKDFFGQFPLERDCSKIKVREKKYVKKDEPILED